MIDKVRLEQMKSVDITKVDRGTLVDINSVHIDSSLPDEQKLQDYLEQIKNPYCFRCGDTPVKIRFVSEEKSLKQSLYNYFVNLK